jgi:hypothetical protein
MLRLARDDSRSAVHSVTISERCASRRIPASAMIKLQYR